MYGELSPELRPIFQSLTDMLKAGKFAPKSDILQKLDELEADIEEILKLWQQINEAFPLENRVCKEPVDAESQMKLAEWKEKIAKLRQAVEKIYALEEKIRPLIEKVANKMSEEQAIDITENCQNILKTMPADISQQFQNAKTPEQLEKALDAFLAELLADKIGNALQGAETAKKRLNFVIIPLKVEDKKENAPQKGQKPKTEGAFVPMKVCAKFMEKGVQIIHAKDAQDAVSQIITILDAQNTMVGSMVIDSHGATNPQKKVFQLGETTLNETNISTDQYLTLLAAKNESGAKYIDENSEIMLSACWAGTENHKDALKDLSAKFNGATVYAQKSVGIGVGLLTNKTFTMIPTKTVRVLGDMDYYYSAEDARNAGLWTKVSAKTDDNGNVLRKDGEILTEVSNLNTLVKIQGDGDLVESDDHFNEKHKDRLEKIANKISKQDAKKEDKEAKKEDKKNDK